ncbi:ABC transporter permease [Pseudosporangium ferrugineum]|uniref:Putative ABC transport system permease protein n=1 Tax=Pseudosporangium ferrugineum TaxID=439699 RepID=A0A2T0SB52_9ACTN|nr:FtsX-like permease family protein [Pseudosporangium ferrugineum]PRY30553.1 putative ABC transport system permease protein [Pseudosporangium ferrugineum]
MIRLTLRTARANLTRSLLSALAVVLGVAFVSGSLMFTEGLAVAMTAHATAEYRNIDVEVSQPDGVSGDWPADMLDRVRKVDGVRAAEKTWSLFNLGLSAGDGRKVIGDHRAVNVAADPRLQPIEATSGRMPGKRGEVVLDERTADREHLGAGDKLLISSFGAKSRTYTLVGLTATTKGGFDNTGALIVMTTPDMEAISGYPSTTIIVSAAPGVSNDDLAARITAAVGARALPHDQLVEEAKNAAVGNAEEFRDALLGFGVIAVCMAAFVIANTFTIVLAQRTREIALLRLVGTTRRQVFRSVVAEAAVVGAAGSVLGLAAGVLLAYGLPAALAAAGAPADVRPVISGTTVLVALAVGIGVTVLSALLPARRGTAVAPVAALSDASVQIARPVGRTRRIAGTVTFAAGLVSLAAANRAMLVIAGALLTVTGFLLLSPVLVPALIRFLRPPLAALGGATAALALLNAARNPRRIATTTNALVVGVTLIATFTLIAKSTEAPAERRAGDKMFAQFLVMDANGLGILPAGVVEALRAQPEIGAGLHPAYQSFDKDSGNEVRTGGTGGPAEGSAVVSADLGLAVGATVTVQGRRFPVSAVSPGTRTVWLSAGDMVAVFGEPFLTEIQVDPAPGVSSTDARAALDRALQAYPAVVAYDHDGYVDHLNARLNQALAVITALLSLAVIIALIGVANTLTLSVVERTRENALLRAVGLTRRQLRRTLTFEALVIALTGTLIGTAISMAITLSALRSVEAHGSRLALVIPWDRLTVLLAVAVLAALTASILPARRAVRHPIAATLAAD